MLDVYRCATMRVLFVFTQNAIKFIPSSRRYENNKFRLEIWTPNVCLIDFASAHVRGKRVRNNFELCISAFSRYVSKKVFLTITQKFILLAAFRTFCHQLTRTGSFSYQKSLAKNKERECELRFSVQTLFLALIFRLFFCIVLMPLT